MGKKRAAAAVSAAAVPFSAPAAAEPEPDHFSDYGFDPQLLLHFFSPRHEVKRLWGRRQRHQQQQPAQLKPLDSARFKLQKPISKKHHPHRPQKQQQRRRWWSSAASAALRLFKKRAAASTTRPGAAAAPTTPPPYGSAASSTTVPLYIADYGEDDGGGAAACTCWAAPAVRSAGSRLAAAELGAAAVAVPYVSLRSTSLAAGGGTGGAPVMPIYLVT